MNMKTSAFAAPSGTGAYQALFGAGVTVSPGESERARQTPFDTQRRDWATHAQMARDARAGQSVVLEFRLTPRRLEEDRERLGRHFKEHANEWRKFGEYVEVSAAKAAMAKHHRLYPDSYQIRPKPGCEGPGLDAWVSGDEVVE